MNATLKPVDGKQGAREEKLRKVQQIAQAIEKDKKGGKRLFFYGDVKQAVYDYYRSERTAKIATKRHEEVFAEDGSLLRIRTVYEPIEEIDLAWIQDCLRAGSNPFSYLCHSYTDYPYRWMQDMEDLFLEDPQDKTSGWNDRLFPSE